MIKIAICDDEIIYQKEIFDFVNEYFTNNNYSSYEIEIFDNGRKLIDKSEESKYDIIFLDIILEDDNGIDVAMDLKRKSPESILLFVTSYLDFAVCGYKVEAFRYILKNEIRSGINEALGASLKKIEEHKKAILFKFVEGERCIELKQIKYIESNGHKAIFYIVDDDKEIKYTIYEKLDNLEKIINFKSFIRVHKSYIVNCYFISSISNYVLFLKSGEDINISRNRYIEVKKRYTELSGGLL